jgi:hypothetical protein
MLKGWLQAIEKATWGDPALGERLIWVYLKSNMQSKNSYLMGSTIEECDKGYLKVADQDGPDRVMQRRNIIPTFCDLFAMYVIMHVIMPHKFHLWRKLVEINNAATFG